jgi:hypothetical protein
MRHAAKLEIAFVDFVILRQLETNEPEFISENDRARYTTAVQSTISKGCEWSTNATWLAAENLLHGVGEDDGRVQLWVRWV